MKVAILGFGLQGQSAYKHYRGLGYQLTICDQKQTLNNPPPADLQLGPGYLQNLSRFDLLVRTSSLQPAEIVKANSQAILEKVTTTSNEFFKRVSTPIIAVTGTKGKGTTCLLAKELLEAAGLKVCLVGNIGLDALSFLDEARQADVVVFEIASYQTMDLNYSPRVGVALNIMPDHIDWHGDFESYLEAKAQLFAHQKADDKAVYFVSDSNSIRAVRRTKAVKVGYAIDDNPAAHAGIKNGQVCIGGIVLLPVGQLALSGRYNWENICAALVACEEFMPGSPGHKAMIDVLRRFANPENRLEFVREVNGVKYINDSFATNPHAARAALEAIEAPKILIVGGQGKGIPMEDFFESILKADIKHLIAVGPTAPDVVRFLRIRSPGFSIEEGCQTMEEIVSNAADRASEGDVVLLSPGYAATYPIFGNAVIRAQKFKEAVARLNPAQS